jgi:hypothetical protein
VCKNSHPHKTSFSFAEKQKTRLVFAMRLLRIDEKNELSVSNVDRDDIPPYAILSHTWGRDADEVTLTDLMENTGKSKVGYDKLQFCKKQATQDGLHYIWIDTCCIDKSSSAELTYAINSMFRWYRDATKCYVYLSDVSAYNHTCDQVSASWQEDGPSFQCPDQGIQFPQALLEAFMKSRWFTRGWTLQELIAPMMVEFFTLEGKRLGDKMSLGQQIHEITGIAIEALQGTPLSHFTINQRMEWQAKRQTKQEEDHAYSLLGIFDVSMPLIYGEGREKALRRLYDEIDKPFKAGPLNFTPEPSDIGISVVVDPESPILEYVNLTLPFIELLVK